VTSQRLLKILIIVIALLFVGLISMKYLSTRPTGEITIQEESKLYSTYFQRLAPFLRPQPIPLALQPESTTLKATTNFNSNHEQLIDALKGKRTIENLQIIKKLTAEEIESDNLKDAGMYGHYIFLTNLAAQVGLILNRPSSAATEEDWKNVDETFDLMKRQSYDRSHDIEQSEIDDMREELAELDIIIKSRGMSDMTAAQKAILENRQRFENSETLDYYEAWYLWVLGERRLSMETLTSSIDRDTDSAFALLAFLKASADSTHPFLPFRFFLSGRD
jgi:hypothetical protein